MRRGPPAAGNREHRQHNERHEHIARRFVRVRLILVIARRAVKREEEKPKDVEGGQACRQHSNGVEREIGVRPRARSQQYFVLAEKARKAGGAGNRERGGQHRGIGPRNALAQAAHAPHILLAAHGMDHAAGAEKEQSFEEGVSHQMKDAGAKRPYAASQEHVAQLADGRIGENFFDVSLNQSDGGGKKGCRATNHGDRRHGDGRVEEQYLRARDHINAGSDHRRRVDQRANRRGAFHGIRQPDVEWKLCRFASGAGKQQQRDGR